MLEGKMATRLDATLKTYPYLGRRKRERITKLIAEYVPQDQLTVALDKAQVK